jgi:hypothetical protein
VPSVLAWVDRWVVEPRMKEGAVPGALPLTNEDGSLATVDDNQNVGVVTIHLFVPFAIENRAYLERGAAQA